MKSQTDKYVETCPTCSPHARHYKRCVPGVLINPPSQPFEILNADVFYIDNKPQLIITDELTRFAWIIPDIPLKQIANRLIQFFLETNKPNKFIYES